MKKNELFNLILIITLTLAFAFLLVAMAVHAAEGNESDLSVLFAVISAGVGFAGLIMIIIKLGKKEKGDEDEN